MQNDILWLVRLGLDQNLFTLKHATAVRSALSDNVDLMEFAQKLIDDGYVSDDHLESLEKVAGIALAKGKAGPPADNPFVSLSLRTTASVTERAPASAPRISAAPTSAISSTAPTKLPKNFFEQVDSFSDTELATHLKALLRDCATQGASDLHLSANTRPFIRKNRGLVTIGEHFLSPETSLRLNTALLSPEQKKAFLETRDFDYALSVGQGSRYRVNLMYHKGGAAGSYRMVPATIPKLQDLGLRNIDAVKKLLNYHNGLILVTGPVGSGKTTTLAALVAELNASRKDHIITVEDPIEVVQTSSECNLTQREVGAHTVSFATALKGALREDPDVIVIGELRDLETIEMAISASETGHLVIGTMHTSDAATTLNRILDVFPPAQQAQIRASVSESLRGIICQRLLPTTSGGLVLANEMLVANSAVVALIRDGKTQGLRNVIETGLREGMCLMENVVFELWQKNIITADTARQNITSRMLKAKIT